MSTTATIRPRRAALLSWVTVIGLSGVLALVVEVVFPWLKGPGARAPRGILVNGAVEGSLYALTAAALILVYRVSRIINFAQVAIGSSAGFFITQMVLSYDLPLLAMVPGALLIAFLAGALAELAMRRFARAPRLLVTIATITLAPAATLVMGQIVSGLNPLPPSLRLASTLRTVPLPFAGFRIHVDPLFFTFAHVFTVGSALAGLVAVAVVLRWTRAGRAVRAAADNTDGAGLLGVNTRVLSTLVWGLAATLSGLASVAALTLHGMDLAGKDGGVTALLPALAAAMVAGFESIPLAAFFAVWLFVLQQATLWAYPNTTLLEPALLAIIVVALLLRRGTLQRRQAAEAGLSEAARGPRPTPRALRGIPAVRRLRTGVLLGAGALALVFPFAVSAEQIHGGGTVLLYVMITVSLLIVTGWVGQLNLGQFALVAAGAVIAAALVGRAGLSFWLALPVAALAAAAAAVLLGLAALRVQGLWLAPATLVLAAAMPVIVFGQSYSGWLVPSGGVDRPGLLGLDLSDERTFYYVLLAAAGLAVLVALRFRRSRTGRTVIALRDNEAAALAAGIDPLRSRVAALALSGAIAGVAGALLTVYEEGVNAGQFGPELSLNVFVMLILGGMSGVSGAVIGAVFGAGLLYVTPEYAPLVTGVGALMILLAVPGGLSQALFAVRDSVLRLVAVRRRIDVPSLLGSADAPGQRRRWRLAPPDRDTGLAALPAGLRYSKPSILWGRVK